jgi:uncharacterized protein YecT (DUF1311 family)
MVLASLALLTVPATAADNDCSAAVTQTDLNLCIHKDYLAADTRLNALYKSLYAKYDAANRVLLQKAERAWIAYRDADCEYQTAPTQDGTVHPAMVENCMARKIDDRIKELKAQADCAEGDLSCNHP